MKFVRTTAACFLVLFALTAALAGKGNEMKGRMEFMQTCKACHTKGANGGQVTPLNKTMDQWRKYFASGRHNHGQEPLTKVMSAEQLADVETFLVGHAADSPQPETCGR